MFIATKSFTQLTLSSAFRSFARFAKPIKDPGIGRRKRILGIEQNEDLVDFEDIESDFMEVHKSHKEYTREMESLKEREKYLIVRQKYFKEKFPNFLTWHDKEQIRYLHRKDPEEWTVELLSEGFPALPHVIKKIVQSSWSKEKQQKITSHDASVQKNWELFKKGKMNDLPEELKMHLNKFTNRALNFHPFVAPAVPKDKTVVDNRTVNSEFADIIKSYAKTKNIKLETENMIEAPKTEINKVYNRKPVTLRELRIDLKSKIEKENLCDDVAQCIVKKVEETKIESQKENVIDLIKNKFQSSTGIQRFQKLERDISHLNYPERITIPKDIFKKGSIYKLNDCYYDDDGEFLYRVPGMF